MSSDTSVTPVLSCRYAVVVISSKVASVPNQRNRDSRMWEGKPTRRNSLTRKDPPPATSNRPLMLEKSLSNMLTSRSNTPSPRSSTTPMADTLVAWVPQAPRMPPMEWVG